MPTVWSGGCRRIVAPSVRDGMLTTRRSPRRILMRMTAHQWRVLVIRAWRDGAGVRVRVLQGGEPCRQWTAASSTEAGELVQRVIAELEDGASGPVESVEP